MLDPSYAGIDYDKFNVHANWHAFYGDVEEVLPPNAPEPLGKEVELRIFVDSDHAGDKATRRSHTSYMIFINMSMIDWHTKKQATVEGAVLVPSCCYEVRCRSTSWHSVQIAYDGC